MYTAVAAKKLHIVQYCGIIAYVVYIQPTSLLSCVRGLYPLYKAVELNQCLSVVYIRLLWC